MIPFIVKQWEENKHLLEGYFRNNTIGSYKEIVEKLFELVITEADPYCNRAVDKMTVVDDGDYQGTQIFIVPKDVYQPCVEDYIMTDTYYGSCSGCDTLQAILAESDYGENFNEKFNESQIKDLMTLALHLVQKAKMLG